MEFLASLPISLSIPLLLLAASVAYAIGLVAYRLYWHPLAQFPGPKIAAATKWYECFYDTCKGEGGQYAWKVQEMHDIYGPVVRVNPDELHIQDSNYFDTIYAPLPARRDKYPPAAAMMFCPEGTFGTIKHDIHRKRRLANSPLFSQAALRDAHQLIHERVDILCMKVADAYQTGSIIHLHTKLLALTTDVISAYVLGRPLGCQLDNSMADDWNKTMKALPRLIPLAKQFPWVIEFGLKVPQGLVSAVIPKLSTVLGMYRQMHDEARLHAERRAYKLTDEKPRKDSRSKQRLTVFEAIDLSNLPREEKDIHRQAQEAFVLISAGTETAARSIGAILYHLVANPAVLAKLRRELSQIMPMADDRTDVSVLEAQPFLTAVVKEGLRVMQLMTSRLPLLAADDLQYRDWRIPAGTPVSMTISEVLADPAIFPDPHAFVPERWLDAEHVEQVGERTDDPAQDGQAASQQQQQQQRTSRNHATPASRLDKYFVPFGRGTRMCQGKDFAWAEIYIAVARLVRKFDFELHDTIRSRDVDTVRDCFLGTTTEKSPGIRMKVVGIRE